MTDRILLCSDLDRTLLPNGPQEESPAARPLLRYLAARPEVALAYVSGRHRALLLEAIAAYDLPMPAFAIGDVGTTIYQVIGNEWRPWEAWQQEIAPDWQGRTNRELAPLFTDLPALRPQEEAKQNTYKLSYYAPLTVDPAQLLATMQERLARERIRANVIWSVDEQKGAGLVDVLPQSANKLHAITFLMGQLNFPPDRVVFAGDSGNDLDVLTSPINGVLVRNASPEVRMAASETLAAKGLNHTLYCATGDFLGMNGNYAAGVLEGLAHFIPHVRGWLVAARTS